MSGVAGDACGDRERIAHRAPEQRSAHPLGRPHRAGLRGVLEDRADHQLAEPARTVALTQRAPHDIADDTERLVAGDAVRSVKPVDLEELKLLADRARETSLLKQELSYYRNREAKKLPFAGMIGESPVIRAVMEQARQIAALDDTPPVLITGETGTGKGLIAHTIHASGPRASKPFIEVNCTALPASLMEAELFGHERGAFTDAKQSKIGLFEAAERGFIFLDEIGDTELPLQGKLLRAIEERMVRRVGGIRDRKIDVRILAATNRDLEREAQAGTFRRDLYFRLAVILLRLPPLRERGDDVLLLADDFVRRYSTKYGKDVKRMSPAVRDALLAYSWPGNVRELSHVMERAVLWSQGGVLEAEQLSLTKLDDTQSREPAAAVDSDANGDTTAPLMPPSALPPRGTDLAQWEKSMIEQALREANGNQTQAAQRLGVSRDTLRYRLKKFGIQ